MPKDFLDAADEPTQDSDNLPAVTFPDPADISMQDMKESPYKLIETDLNTANAALKMVHQGWATVDNLPKLSRMIDNTIKATKHRRDVLGVPYGYQAKTGQKSDVLEPLD